MRHPHSGTIIRGLPQCYGRQFDMFAGTGHVINDEHIAFGRI